MTDILQEDYVYWEDHVCRYVPVWYTFFFDTEEVDVKHFIFLELCPEKWKPKSEEVQSLEISLKRGDDFFKICLNNKIELYYKAEFFWVILMTSLKVFKELSKSTFRS